MYALLVICTRLFWSKNKQTNFAFFLAKFYKPITIYWWKDEFAFCNEMKSYKFCRNKNLMLATPAVQQQQRASSQVEIAELQHKTLTCQTSRDEITSTSKPEAVHQLYGQPCLKKAISLQLTLNCVVTWLCHYLMVVTQWSVDWSVSCDRTVLGLIKFYF